MRKKTTDSGVDDRVKSVDNAENQLELPVESLLDVLIAYQ